MFTTEHAINHSENNVVINDDLWTGTRVDRTYNTRAIIAKVPTSCFSFATCDVYLEAALEGDEI